ncbi:unnamed protein product, partial [Mesorhabditis spiculigera]
MSFDGEMDHDAYSEDDCSEATSSGEEEMDANEDDAINDGMDEFTQRAYGPKPGELDRKVLEVDELHVEMIGIISEVQAVIPVNVGTARILLTQFLWNKEKLMEAFFGCGDEQAFFEKYNVAQTSSESDSKNSAQHGECNICLEVSGLSGPGCDHVACSNCWRQYLETKISSGSCSQIQCIGTGCKVLIEEEQALKYLGPGPATQKFKKLTLNVFVEANRRIKWCPAPGCGKVIKVAAAGPRQILCSCNHLWCFCCGESWHRPVDCRVLRNWLKRSSSDSETNTWKRVHTRDCPKCHTAIEKNGGCNHMTCRSAACKYEFCWVCMGDWKQHMASYSCNKFEDAAVIEANNIREMAKRALERYLHYYDRYLNHQQSLRLEERLNKVVREKMDDMQQGGASWIEVRFFLKGIEALTEARRTLMYTYPFAYYLKPDNETRIFEDNQTDLEMATEALSELLEAQWGGQDVTELKQKVLDKSSYVDQRRLVLLKHCEEGMERDAWKYTE